jgi:hypothetical protein
MKKLYRAMKNYKVIDGCAVPMAGTEVTRRPQHGLSHIKDRDGNYMQRPTEVPLMTEDEAERRVDNKLSKPPMVNGRHMTVHEQVAWLKEEIESIKVQQFRMRSLVSDMKAKYKLKARREKGV